MSIEIKHYLCHNNNNDMNIYNIDFWMYNYRYDSDVDYTESVNADSLEDAIDLVKNKYPRARNLKQV